MSVKIDSATTSDDYTAACTIEDQWLSSGGYFIISDAEVYAQLQYSEKDGPQGYGQWGTEVHVPTGNGQIFKGTTGIRFRSFTPGTPATISAAIFSRDEPTFIIGSGGISSPGASIKTYHNGSLIADEPGIDFEDANGSVWTIADDGVNKYSTVKVLAAIDFLHNGIDSGAFPHMNLIDSGAFVFTLGTIGTQLNVTPPKFLTGYVSSAGAINNGTGFSVNHSATGTYVITFTSAFSSLPIVIPAGGSGNPGTSVTGVSVNGCTIHTFSTATGSAANAEFFFIAMASA